MTVDSRKSLGVSRIHLDQLRSSDSDLLTYQQKKLRIFNVYKHTHTHPWCDGALKRGKGKNGQEKMPAVVESLYPFQKCLYWCSNT